MLRSVRSRVIALATGIAVAAVVVSSGLATWTTGNALRGEAERSLETDAAIYNDLLAYAQTHADWSQVDALVSRLSDKTARRIALVDARGDIVVDSDRLAGRRSRPLPRVSTAQIDPKAPLEDLRARNAGVPLDPATLARLNSLAVTAASCLAGEQIDFTRIDSALTGPEFVVDSVSLSIEEQAEFRSCISGLVLGQQQAGIPVNPQGEVPTSSSRAPGAAGVAMADPVSLYVGSRAENPLRLSGAGLWRVIGLVVSVAAAAALLSWLLGRRITRPLVALTAATRQLADGQLDTKVPVDRDDEVGELAVAFNSMAESLARNETARRRTTADIAHEMRNPLVTINGTLEAIQDGVYEASPEVIESMIEETGLLRRIINDLQDLGAMDAGTMRIERSPTDLVDLCASLVEVHRALGPGVEVVTVAPATLIANVDADRVRQIVGNLLSNAIRHTPQNGKVTVSILDQGAQAVIEVADTGVGIPPEQLTHVFERLWRADSSRARNTGGSGLGLSIARGLARAHGGDIAVRTSVGRGTTFTLRLPVE